MPVLEVKNNFVGHTAFWWVVMPIFALLVLPYVLPVQSFMVGDAELLCFSELGRDTDAVTNSTNALFQSMFVSTGVLKAFRTMFIDHAVIPQLQGSATVVANFTQQWNNGFWMMVYRAMWRLIALWPIYLAILLSMVIPAFVDGLAQRAIKKYDYKFHNPVYFFSSLHLIALVLGLCVFVPLLPLPLTAQMVAGSGFMLAAAAWMATANFQTGA